MKECVLDRATLEEVLHENVPDISKKNIWIWGAGDTAQLYQEGFRRLSSEGFFIHGYVDNNPSKIGGIFNNKPVISPMQLEQLENICVLLCSIQADVQKEVSAQLNELGIEWYLVDEVILKSHRKDVMSCYDLLFDNESKDIFANLIMWRISGKKTNVKAELGNDYLALPPFVQSHSDEIFVDCGAWRGDVIERYIEEKKAIFKKIIAFEPDKINFKELEKVTEKLKGKWNLHDENFELCTCGVGEKSEKGYFERYETNNGQGSKFNMSVSESEGNCSIVSLDEYLTVPYSFLKADIESFEYKMLLGAEKGIKTNKPLLTICLYHNAVDLYSIPLLIKAMVPEYKMAVRHHTDYLAGTVLYAWI